MPPNLVVLTDFSPAGQRASAYAAALAAPLGAALHLVHVVLPMPLPLLLGQEARTSTTHEVQEADRLLRLAVQALPLPATAEVIEADWEGAVAQAVAHYQPLLVLVGLTATNGSLDEWLSNRTLPLAHQTGYPLLLVPECLSPDACHPPARLLLAVEDQSFQLSPEVRRLAPQLASLGCQIFVATVMSPEAPTSGQAGLRAARQCGLVSAQAELRKVVHTRPASGIWQAADELEADMVALLDQGHGWVHKAFSGSVIADVMRYSQVPVLLLPAQLSPVRE